MSDQEQLDLAAQSVVEGFLALMDGADDDDTVRPALALRALADALGVADYSAPELSAAEFRKKARAALEALAQGDGP